MDERVFDVSRPNRAAPGATSRPIIMGHHPILGDPMVTAHENEPAPEPQAPERVSTGEINEMPRAVFPDSPPVSDNSANSLLPVDGSVTDNLAQNTESLAPDSVVSDQQFMRPSQADEHDNEPPASHPSVTPAPISHRSRGGSRKKLMLTLVIILALLVAGYLAIDAGLVGKGINLPFHVFKQDNQVQTPSVAKTTNTTNSPTASPSSSQPALPTGFVAYKLADTGLNIPYPSAWGEPTSTPEMGYSKRGGTNKADVTYAYLLSFATNKDIQIAVTSSQYLPPARTALYYDFLQWCTGSADAKLYKQTLHFTTAAGVDTPSTATCDQGPLTDAVKVNDTTIVQTSAKATDGTAAGDVYTRNLKITKLPVMRVKDATGKNGDNIKKILENLTLDTTAQTQ